MLNETRFFSRHKRRVSHLENEYCLRAGLVSSSGYKTEINKPSVHDRNDGSHKACRKLLMVHFSITSS
ncbi:unnamed protein product [Haemonchus placei]|uniref:Ovule protein n=1 Tax=Haemonchus placei TaxID=6290 RepID=A0A0N4WJH5_HAEPC|nr:unnamed protein product [Haemonchus placei]